MSVEKKVGKPHKAANALRVLGEGVSLIVDGAVGYRATICSHRFQHKPPLYDVCLAIICDASFNY